MSFKHSIWLLLLTVLSGCSSFSKVQNVALGEQPSNPLHLPKAIHLPELPLLGKPKHETKAKPARYSTETFNRERDIGDNLIILAFSGGGTRAAALSYGVLKELHETPQPHTTPKQTTLLKDVDIISAVSGGSFTAAYYGAFGEQIFEDYEDKFLRQSIESTLISNLLSPGYWYRSLVSGFNRSELAIEYYDKHIFEHKTFADIPFDKRPYIEINATDLSLGSRFAFNQNTFDLICSDLSYFPLARAVTASSAVPLLFPSIVLENHRGHCEQTIKQQQSTLNSETAQAYEKVRSAYADAEHRKYLHLVDGGLSDNLGLRSISDHMEIFGLKKTPDEHRQRKNKAEQLKRILVILVNSSVTPTRSMDNSSDIPAVAETLDAMSEALIQNRNIDTKDYFFSEHNQFEQKFKALAPHLNIYKVEVSFNALKDEKQRRLFNQLPTSLELENNQIDLLIDTGQRLLRESADFKAFKADLEAEG